MITKKKKTEILQGLTDYLIENDYDAQLLNGELIWIDDIAMIILNKDGCIFLSFSIECMATAAANITKSVIEGSFLFPEFYAEIGQPYMDVYAEEMDGIMEVVDYNAYDIKYLGKADISYNPALGTGQIQVRDIHYVELETRTAWEFCQLLDAKYLSSSKRKFEDWLLLAKKYKWIKADDEE